MREKGIETINTLFFVSMILPNTTFRPPHSKAFSSLVVLYWKFIAFQDGTLCVSLSLFCSHPFFELNAFFFILFYFVTRHLGFFENIVTPAYGKTYATGVNKLFRIVTKQGHLYFHPVFPLTILFQTPAKVEFICKRIKFRHLR